MLGPLASRSRRALVTVTATVAALCLSSSADAPAAEPQTPTAHRVVWDRFLHHGDDLRSANLDGSDEVRLFHADRGSIDNLAMSPDGRRVAFAAWRDFTHSRLLVVPSEGGKIVDVLRDAPQILAAGPVGWSPNGRKLVFEGIVDEESQGQFYPSYLFTVRVDGTGLKRLAQVSDGSDNGAVFGGIAWTSRGIVYADGESVRRLWKGRSTIMFRHVATMYPSGDGRTIFLRTVRQTNRGPVDRLYRSSATHADRELVARFPNRVLGGDVTVASNADGTALLGIRDSGDGVHTEAITFRPTAPRDVQVLDFVSSPWIAAWH